MDITSREQALEQFTAEFRNERTAAGRLFWVRQCAQIEREAIGLGAATWAGLTAEVVAAGEAEAEV